MINLLPPDLKQNYRFARRNVTLRRWVVVFFIAFVGVGAIGTYGLLTFHTSETSYNQQIAAITQQLQQEKLDQTKKQVQDMSNSLKLSVKVLSKEVLFSKLINQIGSVMPNGTLLAQLNINKANNGVDLTANATNYNAATQVQVNLTDPSNKIFAKVDIVSITCNAQGQDPVHPCSAQYRALFNSRNQFLFVNQGAKS